MSNGWQPPQDDEWVPPETDEVVDQSDVQAGEGTSSFSPAMFAASQVSQMAPWNKANELYKQGVGRVAEFAGSQGANPYITAAALTPVAIAPELLGAYTSLKGIQNTTNPTLKGLTSSPQELSPQYAAQNKAIGVTRRIPQEGGRLPIYQEPYQYPSSLTRPSYKEGFPGSNPGGGAIPRMKPQKPAEPLPGEVPTRLPGKPSDFMNYANQKLEQFGDRINPQELMDWQVKLQTDMSNTSAIPRFNPQGGTTTIYQQASDLSSRARKTFENIAETRLKSAQLPEGVMPTRAALNQAYAISSRVQEFTRRGLGLTWKVGKAGAIAAAAGAGGMLGYNALR